MREIKFRSFNEADGMEYFNFERINDESFTFYERAIKNSEIMQYTGLKDKNGIEIYEGDICRDRNRKIFIVDELRIALWVIDIDRMNNISDQVVGNIYENKELLDENK